LTNSGILGFVNSSSASVLLEAFLLVSVMASILATARGLKKSRISASSLSSIQRHTSFYINEYLDDSKAGKDIRIYDQGKIIEKASSSMFSQYNKIIRAYNKSIWGYKGNNAIILVLVTGVSYAYIGLKAMSGALGVGSMVEFSGIISKFMNEFIRVTTLATEIISNNRYLEDFFEYLDLQVEMKQGNELTKKNVVPEIVFKDVCFRYPNTSSSALEHIDLCIRPGERVAIVGMNGSGKTTMIKLLCRLYDPTEGQISLQGIDAKDYNYSSYMDLFSVVFQDFKLLSLPVANNVSADKFFDEKEVRKCLKEAGVEERINALSKDIETFVYKDFEKSGVEISGGEAQKIAIARALYKSAPIIILDEPTAALDPIAESEIYERLNDIVKDKTAIFISHRLSSCRFCDRILVFDKGRLIQDGTHELLLTEPNGKYAKMWNVQAQYYIDTSAEILNYKYNNCIGDCESRS
jgi:ATP-binding cassette subfamily B protein